MFYKNFSLKVVQIALVYGILYSGYKSNFIEVVISLNYKIDLGGWNGIFAVPNDVVDRYIKIASGGAVKVLLYFLRHSGNTEDTQQVSNALSISKEDVCDALTFWEQVGLIVKNNDTYTPSPERKAMPVTAKTEQTSVDEMTEEQVRFTATKTAALRSPHFSPLQIADTVKGNDEINFLFKTCEGLYGRPLKHTEQNALVTIIDDIGLPAEVTLMLVDYCFSVDKATPAYMRNMAVEWVENGVTTLSSAEDYISRLQSKYGAESTVKAVFGLDRALSQKEKEFALVWVSEWGFNSEIIRLAYDINVNAKGKFTFPYINKILENWYSKGLFTKDQILEDQQNRANNEVVSSFDTKEIDKIILDDYM